MLKRTLFVILAFFPASYSLAHTTVESCQQERVQLQKEYIIVKRQLDYILDLLNHSLTGFVGTIREEAIIERRILIAEENQLIKKFNDHYRRCGK